jgi:type IV pilus assembly protein PilY1
LYAGTGRYYFKDDDKTTVRRLIGIKEPCYQATDSINKTCTTSKILSDLADQTSTQHTVTDGWYVDLDAAATTFGAERVVTDPVALTNGVVFFTTFKPTTDICSYGGNSYIWATNYNTGWSASLAALKGKALVQVSTGAFEEINLSSAFTDKDNRRLGTPMTGKPPSDAPPILSPANLKPLKKIIHIQER